MHEPLIADTQFPVSRCDDYMNWFILPQDHVEYHIVKGNEGGHFNINKKRGIWSLHFRRRLKEESDFNLEIRGIDKKNDNKAEESLDLNVRIQVVS